ncbi:MAG: hypothetical protein QOF11_2108 [Chloroflexota bacterium]|nr:hypothetical protein [Chloroflexota bacterium]
MTASRVTDRSRGESGTTQAPGSAGSGGGKSSRGAASASSALRSRSSSPDDPTLRMMPAASHLRRIVLTMRAVTPTRSLSLVRGISGSSVAKQKDSYLKSTAARRLAALVKVRTLIRWLRACTAYTDRSRTSSAIARSASTIFRNAPLSHMRSSTSVTAETPAAIGEPVRVARPRIISAPYRPASTVRPSGESQVAAIVPRSSSATWAGSSDSGRMGPGPLTTIEPSRTNRATLVDEASGHHRRIASSAARSCARVDALAGVRRPERFTGRPETPTTAGVSRAAPDRTPLGKSPDVATAGGEPGEGRTRNLVIKSHLLCH